MPNVIQALIQAKNISSDAIYEGVKNEDGWQRHSWKTYLYVDNIQVMESKYGKGLAHSSAETPDTVEIIVGMARDSSCHGYSFEQFASEFGYDEDSRKAYAIWEECERIGAIYGNIFTFEEREAIAECISEEGL